MVIGPDDVLFLDMNGTFMFGQDRFGSDQDYAATWCELLGADPPGIDLHAVVDALIRVMDRLYVDPERWDRFPTVRSVLEDGLPEVRGLDRHERAGIASVLAHHERGQVSRREGDVLRRLAKHHRLIIVSNIWSSSEIWRDHLELESLSSLFDAVVFSSEHGCVKPGVRIYEIALAMAGVPLHRAVFVGDDPEHDISVPRRMGMRTVRISGTSKAIERDADQVIHELGSLL